MELNGAMNLDAKQWNDIMAREQAKLSRLCGAEKDMKVRHEERRQTFREWRAAEKSGCKVDPADARSMLKLPISAPLTVARVKKAFVALARTMHPDKMKNPTVLDNEKFAEIVSAYEILTELCGEVEEFYDEPDIIVPSY
jgi:hypothetical protein